MLKWEEVGHTYQQSRAEDLGHSSSAAWPAATIVSGGWIRNVPPAHSVLSKMPFTSCTGHTRTPQLSSLAAQGEGPHAAALHSPSPMQDTSCACSGARDGCQGQDALQVCSPSSSRASWLTPCSEVLLMHCCNSREGMASLTSADVFKRIQLPLSTRCFSSPFPCPSWAMEPRQSLLPFAGSSNAKCESL